MNTFVCKYCAKEFASLHSLDCHVSRESQKQPNLRCDAKEERKRKKAQEAIEEKEKKKQAKTILANLDVTEVVDTMNTASKTNELLETIIEQNNNLKDKMTFMNEEMTDMKQQNSELKEMVTEFARNPQLLILVDKLYPLSSLRELDLKTPAFKPVLEILDKELPEYPNLVNDETGKVHCKAVKKLNEIQPTVVKDDEKLFYKKGDVLTRGSGEEATKEFIDVIANSGYEYAQKASKDLKSRRESDKDFKRGILKNAACHDSIQDVTDI